MKTLIIVSLVLLLALAVSCVPIGAPSETAPAETVLAEDVDSLGALSDDLSTSELDNLDQDLAEITW